MNKYLKIILISFFIIFMLPILAIAGYYSWLKSNYYVVNGPSEAEVIIKMAIDHRNPSICRKIERSLSFRGPGAHGFKDDCSISVAKALGDASICAQVQVNDYRDNCYSSIAAMVGDESICQSVGELSQYSCYAQVLVQKKDAQACEQAPDLRSKDECYILFAKTVDDISICDYKVEGSDQKDRCYHTIVEYNYELQGHTLTEKDRQLCEKITWTVEKNQCIGFYNNITGKSKPNEPKY